MAGPSSSPLRHPLTLLLAPVHLNESDFPEPNEFRPERFLQQRDDYPGTLGHSAFGWGRRICPGMHLGAASIAINIARMLWAFNIKPALNEKGEKIDVDMYVGPLLFREAQPC